MEDHKTGTVRFYHASAQETEKMKEEPVKGNALACPHSFPCDLQTAAKIQLLEKQCERACEQSAVLVELAKCYLEVGRIERSEELLDRAIRGHGQYSRIFLLLGKARESAGDCDKALAAYLAALQNGAMDSEVEAALFREGFLLKTYPHSVTELWAVAARKKSGSLWRLLARVCETKNDDGTATALLVEALRENPNDIASLSILARIAERQQKLDEATAWHHRILEVNPNLLVSNLFLAQQHYARGEYVAALPHFERLLLEERDDRIHKLYWLLARMHASGIHDLKQWLAEVGQWQDLTAEERPLVQELFLTASKLSLEEDVAQAEQYTLQALHIAPSLDGTSLLAAVERRKKEQTQDMGDSLQPPSSGEEEAEHELSTEFSVRMMTQVMLSSAQEDKQMRRALRRRIFQRVGVPTVMLILLIGGLYAYYQVREELLPASLQNKKIDFSLAVPHERRLLAVEAQQVPVPNKVPQGAPLTPTLVEEKLSKDIVVTANALEIRVSGEGKGNPTRSPDAIRQEVEAYLPGLQEIYEKERAADPSLLGSLVLDLVIEPDGHPSYVGFLPTKDNKKFQEAVRNFVRTWRFSPSAQAVSVDYPFFFLPSKTDADAIMAREKGTATPRRTIGAFTGEARQDQGDTERERANTRGRYDGAGQRFVHQQAGYSITPPAGFTLVQNGQRTVWRGPEGIQLLVQTTSSLGRSARTGCELMHTVLAKKYGRYYRLRGITETHLAGRPAAAWEFELVTEQGTKRKIDIALLDHGVGYGVLFSAPAQRFAAWQPQFEATLRSFRLPG